MNFSAALFVYFAFFVFSCIVPTFANVNQTNNVTMKNKLVLYLLMSLVANFIYPVTVWAEAHERPFLSDEKRVKEEIVLVNQKVNNKTRCIIIPPCSVALIESSLIFSLHSLSEDAEIILYNNANSEILRFSISQYQRGGEINIPIDYLEAGSYTLILVTASGEYWCGYFEYVH